ncbi:hypothetical protein Bca52824_004913 [Brassica carinata]|uniref:Uncharacterized protein n=1 Tax=Brassica carinata TaxID=52824 RepID=A0A8X7WST8_BRACI|nr:hypothetical protein Bca52824_004913 [Brassica carinata]
MNSSTRLSLLSPPPLFLFRRLRLSNLRRLHRLASPHPSVISPNRHSLSLPVSPPPFIHDTSRTFPHSPSPSLRLRFRPLSPKLAASQTLL